MRNDWSAVRVPELGRWQPRLPVSVVIPAYDCQPSLDLVLAALAGQTYPADLLQVVVVDDGSVPPLRLPEFRPANCLLVRVPDSASTWGAGNACHIGVRHSQGEVILRLDADMVVFPDYVEAHARWHHEIRYAVTLGATRFVDVAPGTPDWPAPADVLRAARAGTVPRLFDRHASQPHRYIETMLRHTDRLRAADHLAFMAHAGASAAVHRELYDAAGGLDTDLRLGEDTEFGYRLAQAGALFVPDRDARGWHLGRTGMMRAESQLQRYSRPFLADRMPQPRWLRKAGGTGWAVPLVVVVLPVDGQPLELVRAAADSILRNDETDIRLCLVGRWGLLAAWSRPPLADPLADLRLIAATYRSDPRVRLVHNEPDTAFPSPYLLRVPTSCALLRTAIGRVVGEADRYQAGLVRVPVPGGELALWRTSALGRARWARHGESQREVVAATYGTWTLTAAEAGVVDLTRYPARVLAAGGSAVAGAAPVRRGRWLAGPVEVAGVRSLARAGVLVCRLSVARAGARLRRSPARLRRLAARCAAPTRRVASSAGRFLGRAR